MKTPQDPRHLERVQTMKQLFAWEFSDKQATNDSVKKITRNLDEIDQAILKAAPSWPLEKINKIDLAVLRLAVYELLIERKTPPKVVVDEAVELAKEYGSESSPAFINGALGKLITENNIQA